MKNLGNQNLYPVRIREILKKLLFHQRKDGNIKQIKTSIIKWDIIKYLNY